MGGQRFSLRIFAFERKFSNVFLYFYPPPIENETTRKAFGTDIRATLVSSPFKC